MIIGGLGGRVDHSLANIQDMAGFSKRGLYVEMYDEYNYITVMCGRGVMKDSSADLSRLKISCDIFSASSENAKDGLGYDGLRLGLIALTEKVTGVCSSGVEYPLQDAVLGNTFPLGAGNYFTAPTADIKIASGIMLVTVSKNT